MKLAEIEKEAAVPGRDWWRAELGLPDGAVTLPQIIAAFRVRVKQTHPNAGGTVEAFKLTKRAKFYAQCWLATLAEVEKEAECE
jgi:hypothetical protein